MRMAAPLVEETAWEGIRGGHVSVTWVMFLGPRSCDSCALLTDLPSNDTKSRCELKRRKAGLSKGLISINYKACTMTCMGEVINLTAPTL